MQEGTVVNLKGEPTKERLKPIFEYFFSDGTRLIDNNRHERYLADYKLCCFQRDDNGTIKYFVKQLSRELYDPEKLLEISYRKLDWKFKEVTKENFAEYLGYLGFGDVNKRRKRRILTMLMRVI